MTCWFAAVLALHSHLARTGDLSQEIESNRSVSHSINYDVVAMEFQGDDDPNNIDYHDADDKEKEEEHHYHAVTMIGERINT